MSDIAASNRNQPTTPTTTAGASGGGAAPAAIHNGMHGGPAEYLGVSGKDMFGNPVVDMPDVGKVRVPEVGGGAAGTVGRIGGGVIHMSGHMPIAAAAADLLRDYDADGDGAIDVHRESTKHETVDSIFSDAPQFRTSSIEALAGVADRYGNNDGKVTKAELEKVLRKYDTGDEGMPSSKTRKASKGDGVLSGSEAHDFSRQLGEHRSESMMPQIPKGPTPPSPGPQPGPDKPPHDNLPAPPIKPKPQPGPVPLPVPDGPRQAPGTTPPGLPPVPTPPNTPPVEKLEKPREWNDEWEIGSGDGTITDADLEKVYEDLLKESTAR